MKIASIKDRRLKALVADTTLKSVKGLEPKVVAKIGPMIDAIVAMTNPLQLRDVPAWRAHELTPGHPGKWAMTVTPNFRLTFRVDLTAQTVSDLQVEDYH